MKKYYFISGLPRSGSTLLCNILAQNPNFHSTHTSGCLDVIFGVRNAWDQLIEHKAHPKCKIRVLRAILDAYHQDVDKPIVFDKSRGWTAYVELIEKILDEKVKVLVPVRKVPDILASMEKLHRETAKIKQPPGEAENYFLMQTVEGRCEYWCQTENLIGLAYNRVRDALARNLKDRLHFVHFERLTSNPKQTMKEIYDFLGQEYFKHNFDHIEQITWEDDTLHGYVGLHDIKSKIEAKPSDAVNILGEQLVKKYEPFSFSE